MEYLNNCSVVAYFSIWLILVSFMIIFIISSKFIYDEIPINIKHFLYWQILSVCIIFISIGCFLATVHVNVG